MALAVHALRITDVITLLSDIACRSGIAGSHQPSHQETAACTNRGTASSSESGSCRRTQPRSDGSAS